MSTSTSRPASSSPVVGPSGCGKSTILDLVAGLGKPSGGALPIDGKPITGPGLDRSVVFQQYTLLPWRTAQANVELALEAKGGLTKARARRAGAATTSTSSGSPSSPTGYPAELSGGMKQRIAIARSLSYEPRVLLMDEPFGALDAQTRESLQEELLAIWRRTGTTVVFITHDIDEAVFLGQRVAVMSARPGRILRGHHGRPGPRKAQATPTSGRPPVRRLPPPDLVACCASSSTDPRSLKEVHRRCLAPCLDERTEARPNPRQEAAAGVTVSPGRADA